MDAATGTTRRLGGDKDTASEPHFSPDGKRLAYFGQNRRRLGPDRRQRRRLVSGVRRAGRGHQPSAALVGRPAGVVPGRPPARVRLGRVRARRQDANGDPMVITRYLYKPTASEGGTRANDNRRLHIFVADVASKAVRQLTDGNYYEHSIDWSPKGDEILFVSNRGPDPDRFFNYDIFAVQVASGTVRRITDTKSAEYYPKWSPDGRLIAFSGTKRPLTSSETTMEDTHVWVMAADGVGTARSRRHRQPPGRARMVARRPAPVFHDAGARDGAADAHAAGRRHRLSGWSPSAAASVRGRSPPTAPWPSRSRRRPRPPSCGCVRRRAAPAR